MSDSEQSYAGILFQLAQEAATLAVHGDALRRMGPVAPPCLARPYREYRDKLIDSAANVYAAFGQEHGDEKLAGFIAKSKPFQRMIDSVPALIGSYSDAPPAWQPEAYADTGTVEGTTETVPMGRVRGLRAGEDEILRSHKLLFDVPRGEVAAGAPAVVKATEAVARAGFWRGLGSGAIAFGKRWFLPLWLAFELRDESLPETMGRMLGRPPAVSERISGVVNQLLDFERDYWPRVAQQWQAMIRIYRASMGNPDLVRKMMAVWDPQKMEKPLPPPPSGFDVFYLGDLLGIQFEPNPHSWVAIPILAAGSIGSMIAVRG
ncbi:MAG: hypothetical protein PHU54_05390 [Candidatus Omnitrophica bacterium]|nr:hypothetical protein [Candidatus Omnitrophota bacterium]